MNSRGGVYKITNISNGKIYIGSSINISKRWREHQIALRKNLHINKYLQNSWNKHGEENFRFEVLEFVPRKKDITEREQWYLDNVVKWGFDYNIATNATKSMEGKKHSKKAREKMSKSRIGKKNHMWGRKGEDKPNYGRNIPNEVKEKISSGLKKYYETHDGWSKGLFGKDHPSYGMKHDEETLKYFSECKMGEKNPMWGVVGEDCKHSKIKNEDVVKIRNLYATRKYTFGDIGRMFDVSSSTIRSIITEETWGHVDGGKRNINWRGLPGQKITRKEVIEIREMYKTGEYTQAEIGKIYGLKPNSVSNIITHKSWKDVK